MDHAVHAADVDECAVAGQGLDGAVILLADLDLAPDLLLCGLALLRSDGTDGADDAAAGTVDLGDAQLDVLLQKLAQIAALGNAGLGSRNEHADALDIDDDAALVLLGDDAFDDVLVLSRSFDLFPCLACFQTLLGQTDDAFAVVDMDNDCFNLIADLDSLFGLDVGVAGEVFQRNVRGVLGAQVDFDLGRANWP